MKGTALGQGSQPFLPYGRQCIDDDDIATVVDVLKSDWLTTGPAVEAFEAELAARVGAKYAVSCSSGTAALHLAALALALGDGDRVAGPVTMVFQRPIAFAGSVTHNVATALSGLRLAPPARHRPIDRWE